MMIKRITLILGLMAMLVLCGNLYAVQHDWASGVANQNGDASPAAGYGPTGVTGRVSGQTWVDTKGVANSLFDFNMSQQGQNSRVDDYINQDEQINLDPNSGTVKVLRTNQKVNTNKFVTELVPLKNATPRELRAVLRTICRKEGGNADVLQDKEKKEYFMQVVCPDFQLPYIRSAAAALDVPWLKVAESGNGRTYYQGKFRSVRDLNRLSQYYRGPEGFFQFDDTNNALYYDDQAACQGLQMLGLKTLDIPPNQVLMEVTVYEVNVQNDDKIGLDFIDWKNGPGRNLFEAIFSDMHSKYKINDGSDSVVTRFNSDYRYTSVDAVATTEFIDFLKVKGKAREMTKVMLMAKSGQTVGTSALDKVLSINAVHKSTPADDETVVRNPAVTDTSVSGIPQDHKRFVNYDQQSQVGINVSMIPYIGLESMELTVAVSAADSVTGLSANGQPVISSRSVSTKVRLKDGEPFVIGGLKRKAEVKRSVKVPILGSIPVLGWAFGQETTVQRETEVVVVVKPKFLIGADSDMEIPQECKTVIAQAEGKEKLELPKNSWGFDQWLLDKDK